jgi:hypothetical protein
MTVPEPWYCRPSGIPAFDEFGRMIKGAKDQLELMDEQLQLASAVGAEFGAYTFVRIYGRHE